jgi:hypothetical protein
MITDSIAPAGASSLADDLLTGVVEIDAYIHKKPNPRRTYYLLENHIIPAGKLGNIWTGSKRRIDAHFAGLTQGTVDQPPRFEPRALLASRPPPRRRERPEPAAPPAAR